MTYGEAQELLIDGRITHKPGDILAYGETRRFYVDQRTIKHVDPEPDEVIPLGKTEQGYWLYVCPDCGFIHSVHQSNCSERRPIICGCRTTRFKRWILIQGETIKIPAKHIILKLKAGDPDGE